MKKVVAIYGSPRREGNTALLLREAVRGAREEGAEIEEVVLRDLKMSPCLEIYGCKNSGRCAIQDDFQKVYESLLTSQAVMLASPIFFYAVSAHTKILMDRCQSLWVKSHWLKETSSGEGPSARKGLFISVGATRGKKLFDGTLLSVRYYFEAIDCELWKSLLYRELDLEGDVLKHPEYLEEAHQAGGDLIRALETG
ncbi:MAG: flavodoxin family protein [Thermodesulfobacteriota bacterium]